MEAINFTLEQFRSVMLAAGYDEVTERSWEPNTTLDVHTHPFDANAIVVAATSGSVSMVPNLFDYLLAIRFTSWRTHRTLKNMGRKAQHIGSPEKIEPTRRLRSLC